MPSCMDNSIRILKGIGEHRAAQFEQGGVTTVGDLLRRYPRSYEDWSHPLSIAETPFGEPCCVRAAVLTAPAEHRIRRGMVLYKFEAGDARARMTVTLFNNPYAAARLRTGDVCLFYGTVGGGFTRREMASPKIELDGGTARLRPVYRQTAGLTSRVVESTVARALEQMAKDPPPDPLPETLRGEQGLCPLSDALRDIHFPPHSQALEQARRRLVFEELLVLQLGLLRLKNRGKTMSGARTVRDYTEEFAGRLPFSLTGAQNRAIADCLRDTSSGAAMSRLIQGDVGSGKTAVAAGVAYTIIREGWQVAMMAPTEILAEQHFRSLSSLLEGAPLAENKTLRIGLLTGSLPAARRRETLAALAAGKLDLLVGTHALLSDGVEFARLGLVITDEQHRFGVEQRALLAAKGNHPHLMVMSATPIPRTLALILYGDLDVSVLDELPPGRTPVSTYAVDSRKRERAYSYVRRHLDQGRQGYIVCPLVEEREKEEGTLTATPLASAVEVEKKLADGPFQGYRIGLLHGRMKPAEKDRVMTAFSAGELDLLVATTVIEVGVDVPNAVIMVIENAERFGLAQLHQLRGRVGRGRYTSSCILISDAQNEEAVRRLRVMCETSDGFRIADEDLKLRGPGDFFGRRQHGLPSTRLADLSGAGDLRLFQQAQEIARGILREDPTLKQPVHTTLAEEVRRLFCQVGEQGLN